MPIYFVLVDAESPEKGDISRFEIHNSQENSSTMAERFASLTDDAFLVESIFSVFRCLQMNDIKHSFIVDIPDDLEARLVDSRKLIRGESLSFALLLDLLAAIFLPGRISKRILAVGAVYENNGKFFLRPVAYVSEKVKIAMRTGIDKILISDADFAEASALCKNVHPINHEIIVGELIDLLVNLHAK